MIKAFNGIFNYSFTSRALATKPNKDKTELVNKIFSRAADSYDLMNDAISLGVHRVWKKEMVKSLGNIKDDCRFT